MYRLEKQLNELGYELVDNYYHEYYQKHIVDGICLKAEKSISNTSSISTFSWKTFAPTYFSICHLIEFLTEKKIGSKQINYKI